MINIFTANVGQQLLFIQGKRKQKKVGNDSYTIVNNNVSRWFEMFEMFEYIISTISIYLFLLKYIILYSRIYVYIINIKN